MVAHDGEIILLDNLFQSSVPRLEVSQHVTIDRVSLIANICKGTRTQRNKWFCCR